MSIRKKPDEALRKCLGQRIDSLMNQQGYNARTLTEKGGGSFSESSVHNALKGDATVPTCGLIFKALGYQLADEVAACERSDNPTRTVSASIDRHILDQSHIIAPKREVFVGRRDIMSRIDDFFGRASGQPGGYFVLSGDPGIGKTAIVANLPARSAAYPSLPAAYVMQFNNRASGPRSTREFVANVCGQIIRRFALPYGDIPADEIARTAFLEQILIDAGRTLDGGDLAIVVDALDETDDVSDRFSRKIVRNVLGLPKCLPRGVNFILTTRRDPGFHLTSDRPRDEFEIDPKGRDNEDDLREYVHYMLDRAEGLSAFIAGNNLDREAFTGVMLEKAEGNFLFLHHVLSDMAKTPRPTDLGLVELPRGLIGYYEQHWERIRCENIGEWDEHRLPVIAAFCAERAAMTVEHLAALTGISQGKLPMILREWQQFVRRTERTVAKQAGSEERVVIAEYSIYHSRFLDFLENRPEIRDTGRVDELRDRFDDATFGIEDGEH